MRDTVRIVTTNKVLFDFAQKFQTEHRSAALGDHVFLILKGLIMTGIEDAMKMADKCGWTGVELVSASSNRLIEVAKEGDPKRNIGSMTFQRRDEDQPQRMIAVNFYEDHTLSCTLLG
jgi:hypothetical protein